MMPLIKLIMSKFVDFFTRLFNSEHSNDVVEFKETLYSCVINDKMSWHKNKQEMLNYIEEYSKTNVIYSLTMFRSDMFNLLK